MIIGKQGNKQYINEITESLVDYFDIKKGDVVCLIDYTIAPKGYCGFYRVTIDGSKVHYLYTAEVSRGIYY